MGNIADALEKAGVELLDQPAGSGLAEQIDRTDLVEDTDKVGSSKVGSSTAEPADVICGSWDERIDLVANRSTPAAEAFRMLRSRILFPQDGKIRPRTIMVTSSAPQEGKSFVSVNLAVAMARGLDQHSLLVDCDLRYPSLAGLLGLGGVCKRGLTEYLQEECDLPELISKTVVEKLSLLPCGSIPANPAELLVSSRMINLVEELSGRYSDRFIIFDSPPFQVASEAVVLSQKVDGVVLVVGSGKSDRRKIKEMIDNIGQDKIIGVVFNGYKESSLKKRMFDPYGGYGKYYGSEEK